MTKIIHSSRNRKTTKKWKLTLTQQKGANPANSKMRLTHVNSVNSAGVLHVFLSLIIFLQQALQASAQLRPVWTAYLGHPKSPSQLPIVDPCSQVGRDCVSGYLTPLGLPFSYGWPQFAMMFSRSTYFDENNLPKMAAIIAQLLQGKPPVSLAALLNNPQLVDGVCKLQIAPVANSTSWPCAMAASPSYFPTLSAYFLPKDSCASLLQLFQTSVSIQRILFDAAERDCLQTDQDAVDLKIWLGCGATGAIFFIAGVCLFKSRIHNCLQSYSQLFSNANNNASLPTPHPGLASANEALDTEMAVLLPALLENTA